MTTTASALTGFRPDTSPRADDVSMFAARSHPTVKVRIQHAEETPRWLPYVIVRLRDLQRLLNEPAYEVPTPDPDALERALSELARFMRIDTPTPSVVPTYDGGVQFVWHKGGWDVEVEVGPKETLVWAQRRDGSVSWDGSLNNHIDEVRALLSELTIPT
jgi:hypothetical protein